MSAPGFIEENVRAKFPNFDNYAAWVKKAITLGHYSGGNNSTWMDHTLLIHRERKGQLVGSLDRETITELRTKWFEMALPYLENTSVSDPDKTKLQKDLDAIKWAGICLDRLIDHDASQPLNAGAPPSDQQDNPFNEEPIQVDPASGQNDEAGRGETLEQVGNEKDLGLQFAQLKAQVSQSAEFEVSGEQSQPEPALPPVAPISQSVTPPEPSTGAMVDPAFIHTREQFLEACHVAAERVTEAQNVWEAKQVADLAEMLEALARTKQLSKKLELWAKSIRLRAYFKVAQFQQATGQNGEKLNPTDERLVRDLKKLDEDSFEQIIDKGLEKGNLAERLFRASVSKSTRGTPRNKADQLDPQRFFLSLICDMRANPSYYSQVGAAKFLDNPLILENLDPIEEHYVNFSIAIIGALRARRALNVPHGTSETS